MRTCKWMMAAFLLVALSATAQEAAAPASSPETTTPVAPSTAPQPASITTPAPTAQAAPSAPPTTMEQVVDRAIVREHGLITFLQTRTPLVETYLQNLKLDPQMGPAPKEDHYFFGRLDLSDSVDRQDYLSGG